MKHLLNTLYVTSENSYLSLDGENVVVSREKAEVARFPLHTLQGIICFAYPGASPALMGACVKHGINLAFCTPRGKFLARVTGDIDGNVLLRRQQYRIADNLDSSCSVARNMIIGKLFNSRWCIERTVRDHGERLDAEALKNASAKLKTYCTQAEKITDIDELRGLEAVGAVAYFDVLDQMILRNKNDFYFHGRNRRPPLDNVNAMLSFAYSLLSNDCASALESVGLDSYVGFMHRDRPGRTSLALDLMEELRSCFADRFVITLINNQVLQSSDFEKAESGAVTMTDDARRKFLKAWQERKQDTITHPYLEEKMQWGLVPYIQALLLARTIRGDLEEYPPFLWK